jgi:hypothetical protein
MATKNITVNEYSFPCPVVWSVDQAKTEIRSRYLFVGGGLEANGIPLLGTEMIQSTVGVLSFVGGQSTHHGKVHYLPRFGLFFLNLRCYIPFPLPP